MEYRVERASPRFLQPGTAVFAGDDLEMFLRQWRERSSEGARGADAPSYRSPGAGPSGGSRRLDCSGLSSRRRADVAAELVQVRAGILEIPLAKSWLIRRHEHSNQNDAAKQGDKQDHKPHDWQSSAMVFTVLPMPERARRVS